MALTREERAAAARNLFSSLALSDWQEISLTRPQGGQAGILVVERDDGARGAFRCLHPDSEAIVVKRFHRELRILAQFKHPNVMELLDQTTSDACWYISRLGETFNDYWERLREELVDRPEELVSEAIRLLRAISGGLAECHARGIVHRDIKPANLVMMNDDGATRPVLIDFGIAYVDDEPRYTPDDDAVGNARYSPSRMQWRQETVSPWFDLFELSQVMLWMLVAERAPKHYWQRPVDWRFVPFDPRLPPRTTLKLQAIAALCSEEKLSPKDGQGLFDLLTQFFSNEEPDSATPSTMNGDPVQSGLAQAAAIDALRKAEDEKVIESAYPAAVMFADAVRDSVWNLVRRLFTELPQCKFHHCKDGDFGSGHEEMLTQPNHPSSKVFKFYVEASDRPHCGFCVRMYVRIHRPSAKKRRAFNELPEGANPFVFTLGASAIRGSVKLDDFHVMLTLHNDGRIVLQETGDWGHPLVRNGVPAEGITVSVQDVVDRIGAWCTDQGIWELVAREYP